MRTRLALLLVLVGLSIACRPAAAPIAVGNKPVAVNNIPVKDAPSIPTKPIHEMSWTGFDGSVQKVKDLKGKAVILDFWATYCPPCIEEIPHLKALRAKYPDDLLVIGLHVGGAEDKPKVPEFVDRLKIDYPLASPEDALTSFIFGNDTAIPQTAVFDRQGKLVKKIRGFSDQIKTELDLAVQQAVNSER